MTDPNIAGVQRSLFPEGVEVHERHLAWTESTKIIEILRRFLNTTTQGVFSGLAASINAVDDTLIDVASGDGYTVGSVFAELTAGQVGVALADYTSSTINYVTLVAADDDQDPEPHEFNGTAPYTKVARTATFNILTETSYNALTSAQKDLRLIIAQVTAQGAGISLVPSNIVQSSAYIDLLTSNQPSAISGVRISEISITTSLGVGELEFIVATTDLRWKAPGDALFGTAVTVSASGEYTLANNGATSFIKVVVTTGSLPGLDASDNITVVNLYGQLVNRLTAEDDLHRSKVGSGLPSENNPHGLSADDLGEGILSVLEEHQDLEHSNGIEGLRGGSTVASSITNGGASPDFITVGNVLSGEAAYVNGVTIVNLSTTQVIFSDAVLFQSLYEVYLDQGAFPRKSLRAQFSTNPVNILGLELVDLSKEKVAGSYILAWVLADSVLSWDGGDPVEVTDDGQYILYDSENIYSLTVDVIVGSLPGTNKSDTIVVTDHINEEFYLWLAITTWDGVLDLVQIVDKRLFGTMAYTHIRDDARLENFESPTDELRSNGIVNDPDLVLLSGATALTPVVESGVSYVTGKRFVTTRQVVTLIDGSTNYIYINETGIIQVVQSQDDLPDQRADVATVTLVGGLITSLTDTRRLIGHLDERLEGQLSVDTLRMLIWANA